jgi:hypothetical protein
VLQRAFPDSSSATLAEQSTRNTFLLVTGIAQVPLVVLLGKSLAV